MIAELKRENEAETVVLNQAANASHTCLVLCEQLAKLGARDSSPIIAFTSVGPEAKVFITYRAGTVEDGCYVCPAFTSTYCFPIQPLRLADSFFHLSECLAYGMVTLESCWMPFNFGA